MEMNKNIVLNYLIDLSKKEINKFERASLLREYMKSTHLSIRALSIKINVPKSTIEDWLLYNHMSEEEYKKCLDSGISITQIYASLRKTKGEKPKSRAEMRLDTQLSEILVNLRRAFSLAQDERRKETTFKLLHDIKNTVNRIKMRLDQNDKKGHI